MRYRKLKVKKKKITQNDASEWRIWKGRKVSKLNTQENSSHLLTVLHIKDLNEVGFPGIVLCQGCRSRYSFLPTPSSLCNCVIASHLSALDVFLWFWIVCVKLDIWWNWNTINWKNHPGIEAEFVYIILCIFNCVHYMVYVILCVCIILHIYIILCLSPAKIGRVWPQPLPGPCSFYGPA